MASIINKIVASKANEINKHKAELPISKLEDHIISQPGPLNFSGALMGDGIRLIAEIKQSSPSKGILSNNFDPLSLATTYIKNGAAAISVLTDSHFQGTLENLNAVQKISREHRIPVLRKDFIIDPYQVLESRAYGADAILLIASILTDKQLEELLSLSNSLWMQSLVEIHDKEELQMALNAGAEIIGINNRDLHTFNIDIATTEVLAPLIPQGKIIVSESGIFTHADASRIKTTGANAILVGEAIITAKDIAAKVRELSGNFEDYPPYLHIN